MISIIPCEHCGSLNGMPVDSMACVDCGKEREHWPSYEQLRTERDRLREACSYALGQCSEAFNAYDFEDTCDRVVVAMDRVLNHGGRARE